MNKTNVSRSSLFIIGSGFWKTAQLLSQRLGSTSDFDLVSPIFVNLAFSCEVYLECLILIQTANLEHGHDLYKLFLKLPSSDRGAIEKRYVSFLNSSPIVKAMKRDFPSTDLTLDKVLSEFSQTFQNWRYSYEGAVNQTIGLGEFVNAIQRHLMQAIPELNKALHVPFPFSEK
jgi:hypothetical protein